ncbi:DUF2256 domain-containing protein [Trinickia dabaoshanensis]|uniref:DUF2256 domain-containing protein n=1 Tax=Trinickia dabaoshanensis TaxID=564714 RepID=A0A2N7VLN3_9BURK|nr:DUF2256 domain-containing protein [Trinickia dabaoshanensis]PMS18074.1 DUF2256 domain-containing protein [Trinickia dabaoshanensis]
MNESGGDRSNKQPLCKRFAACGRAMIWRYAWAKNWADVRHCSGRCRRRRSRTRR